MVGQVDHLPARSEPGEHAEAVTRPIIVGVHEEVVGDEGEALVLGGRKPHGRHELVSGPVRQGVDVEMGVVRHTVGAHEALPARPATLQPVIGTSREGGEEEGCSWNLFLNLWTRAVLARAGCDSRASK